MLTQRPKATLPGSRVYLPCGPLHSLTFQEPRPQSREPTGVCGHEKELLLLRQPAGNPPRSQPPAAERATPKGGQALGSGSPRIQPAPHDLPTSSRNCSLPLFFLYCSPALYKKASSVNRKPNQKKQGDIKDKGSPWG